MVLQQNAPLFGLPEAGSVNVKAVVAVFTLFHHLAKTLAAPLEFKHFFAV